MTPKETVLVCCSLVLAVLVLSACVSIEEYNREVEACNERIEDAQAIIDKTAADYNERIDDAQAIIDKTQAGCNERIEDAQAIIDNSTKQCNAAVEKTVRECNKLLDLCRCDGSLWTY